MSREKVYTAYVLKRQDYNETDQIITLFTKEEGKLRCLVKASKLPTSKLQPALQPLFKVGVTLAGNGGMPKVIRAQVQQSYPNLFEEHRLNCWYLISELLNKSLGDSAPNEPLFELVEDYLAFLQNPDLTQEQVNISAMQFQIKALRELGMAIRSADNDDKIWFSTTQGGFINEGSGVDAIPVNDSDYQLFSSLKEKDFSIILNYSATSKLLSQLISRFLAYQLERELKTTQFLNR